MIEILSPGIMASVQDLGREGFRAIGVGQSGAMDPVALQVGNLLVGNAPDLAGIEFTLGGFSLRFESDTTFALTGAHVGTTLDGSAVPPWWVRRARAGQVLSGAMAAQGMRCMLCVAGGIDVAAVMGARATDLKGGFGGHEGRLLAKGDRLAIGASEAPPVPEAGFGLDPRRLDLLPPRDETVLRFLPAAEWDTGPQKIRDGFLGTTWTLLPASNRMGCQLGGPDLRRDTPLELHSHAIVPGTIQLPPGGQPVIQLNDANTCGGYPKLGVVIAADLPKLAQTRLGGSIRFALTDHATALAASRDRQARLDWLPGRIALAREYAGRFKAS
ncbi:biotin-dependent carboxyltransferase family protein [Roseovarius sp.]|mgnify:CR=1 FL=1|uniref:5-oxoprolinase subunit C family protein n=1 Tax=Roseovarius sp. TaxID=1486281 RepID=UPI000C3B45E7|nr:biotin-dependent carboxyltransferase family protein [Roseovarius sp.]MAZ20992.1 allophanate hydrolase [Roseovarius sp.]